MKLNAAILLSVVVFQAVFSAPAPPKDTVSALRREVSELNEKLLRQDAELRQLKQWLATVAVGDGDLKAGERERTLLNTVKSLSSSGVDLAVKVDDICNEIRSFLKNANIDPVRRTQLIIRIEELEKIARRFSALAGKVQRKSDDYRIIALDRDLGAVIISGGSSRGIFPGVIFRSLDGGKKFRLRVTGVRPQAAVAELIDGKWEELTPGMAVTAFSKEPVVRE